MLDSGDSLIQSRSEDATNLKGDKISENSNGDPSNNSVQSATETGISTESGDEEKGGEETMGSQQQQNGGSDVVVKDEDSGGGATTTGEEKQATVSSPASSSASVTQEVKSSDNKTDMMDVDKKDNQEENGSAAGDKKENQEENESVAGGNKSENGAAAPAPAPAPADASPPPPVLRGTLSYNTELRRHLIRGMWNYENSNAFPPQRFELLRNLDAGEDPTILPKDGEFHGSFSLAYFHTTSKGKQKERSKVIPESGVNIKFTPVEGEEGTFKVDGTGTNQFGIFHINGTATRGAHDDGQYDIVLRKRYEPSSQPAVPLGDAEAAKKSKKRKMGAASGGSDAPDAETGHLPPPSQSYEKNVVCLRGKVYKEESDELGSIDVVHRINGMWSSGLDLILADPQNVRGLCNRFEYEHKSSNPSSVFPVSGRYSGWFDLNLEDGSKKKILEKDVTLRFRKNNAGYYNVEGRGSNAFGKYSITGTMTADNVITIFRHFQVKKTKASRPVTSAPPPINAPGQARRPSLPATPDPQLKIDEVKVPAGEEPLPPLQPPEHPTYSAVSRGVLRLLDDGSLSCQGKWAVTREHFTNGQTSNFTFRLESHFAAEALEKSKGRQFPLDSEMYKGSFQLKKGGSRYHTVIDQQIVMKFRKNTAGSYNVYGKGVNSIGVFNITGTLIMSGKTGGQVEVYRMYPPELLAPKTPAPSKVSSSSQPVASKMLAAGISETPVPTSSLPPPPKGGLTRRESTRLVKVPSRLEDDDPGAQLQRIMDKCSTILRFIREKDVERGAFFSEPVDPVALGIPTYHQVIQHPMDLRTLSRKMDAKEVASPEEFAKLVRLVFENAMTFNVDPTHSVHQAARNLLILFNQKYRDIERMVTNIRRSHKGDDKRKGKDEKKRKRGVDDTISLKRRRLDEAQEMAAANASSMAAIAGAVPRDPHASVSRNEFSLLVQMISQLQQHVLQTHTALAEMSSDEPGSGAIRSPPEIGVESMANSDVFLAQTSAPERKKTKKKVEPKPIERLTTIEEDSRPLTLQEQELLTETINDLPHEKLHGVIQIIREAAKISGEEEEIDLEIDQLDALTQRKLLRHVSKFIKKPKPTRKSGVGKGKKSQAQTQKRSEQYHKKEKSPPPTKKKDPDSFFAFDSKEDSDSDSEGEITAPSDAPSPAPGIPVAAASSVRDFSLGEGFGDDESDNGEDIANGAVATSWNISQPTTSENKDADEDDGWAGAREKAAIAKVREEDKKKREEKMKVEAEQAQNQRLADAVAHGEELKNKRKAKEEEEARLQEQKAKEAEEERQKAREAARAQAQSVEQTVDFDLQREMMKEYEQSVMDKEMGSASPSSDFGF